MIIIGVTDKFDSAHYLPHYDGKCKNLHGHTWHLTAELIGDINPEGSEKGMVMDLTHLKTIIKDVLKPFDHTVLNNVLKVDPTCENLLLYLKDMITIHPLKTTSNTEIYRIKLQEGEGGYAVWQKRI